MPFYTYHLCPHVDPVLATFGRRRNPLRSGPSYQTSCWRKGSGLGLCRACCSWLGRYHRSTRLSFRRFWRPTWECVHRVASWGDWRGGRKKDQKFVSKVRKKKMKGGRSSLMNHINETYLRTEVAFRLLDLEFEIIMSLSTSSMFILRCSSYSMKRLCASFYVIPFFRKLSTDLYVKQVSLALLICNGQKNWLKARKQQSDLPWIELAWAHA